MSDGERIFDFQHVDLVTIQKLFSIFVKDEHVEEFSRINSGMSTSNYIVKLSGQTQKYVLRIYPIENDHCKLEVAAYKYAATRVNVPTIYHVNHSQNVIPNSYLIMEYIEGETLTNFILSQKDYPLELVRKIGSGLSRLHNVEYSSMGLLNEYLDIYKTLDSLKVQYISLLDDYAGKHIQPNTRNRLLTFLQDNSDFLKTIESKYVFSHGDFNYSNIIISSSLEPYFIDMEYCFSVPIFYDIGKFFRSKNPDVQKYVTTSIKAAFKEGYNMKSTIELPDNWYILAKFTDISAMLHMINKPSIPDGWGEDIDDEIIATLDLIE